MTSNELKRSILGRFSKDTKIRVRSKKNHMLVTFVEHPHNLVSTGAVVNSIVRPSYTDLIDLPWSSVNRISPLLSREGKRVTRVVLSTSSYDTPLVVTVAPELWWKHFVQRNHELGVLPKLRGVDARLQWRGTGWGTV